MSQSFRILDRIETLSGISAQTVKSVASKEDVERKFAKQFRSNLPEYRYMVIEGIPTRVFIGNMIIN